MSIRKDTLGLSLATVTVPYPRMLLDILAERGIGADAVLHGTRLHPSALEKPDGSVSPMQWGVMVMNAMRLTGDQGICIELGLRLPASAHGMLTYAAMTAPDLRGAVQVALRYVRTRVRQYHLVYAEKDGMALLEMRAIQPSPVLDQPFMFELVLVSLLQGVRAITGFALDNMEMQFRWPEPAYFAPYRARLPPTRFSCEANRICCPVDALQAPLPMANDTAHQQVITQVERDFAAVREDEGDILERLRAELVLSPGGYSDVGDLAEHLHLSTRTLRRRILEAGSSYRELLDEARYRDARHFLEASDLDLQTIAARLGFTNPANFTRAFRRWSGLTPSGFRQQRRDAD